MSEDAGATGGLIVFEDLVPDAEVEAGPCVVEAAAIDHFVGLTREAYPIHTDERFAARTVIGRRIPPGKLIFAVAQARLHAEHGVRAVERMRSAHYDFLSPIYAGEPFKVRCRILSCEPMDQRIGVVTSRLQIVDDGGRVRSVARLVEVVLRRSALDRGS
jgi:acyl dehydratase